MAPPAPMSAEVAAPGRRRVVLVAGEASGDMHGADFVRALRAAQGEVDVVGIGGPRLRAAGMRLAVDAAGLGTMGVFEAVQGLRRLWNAYRTVRGLLDDPAPDLCVLIDFPEFNFRVARAAKRAGVPVLYYVGPQVWAWRQGRVRTVAELVDRLAVVFPFEADLYRPWLSDVHFVGHPLIDRVGASRSRAATLEAHGLDPARRTVLLLPGSRTSEIAYLLPCFLDAVRVLAAGDPTVQFVLALAETLEASVIAEPMRAAGLRVPVVAGATYDLMAAADVALVASGTATLECALLECPMVIAYRLSPLTAGIGRLLIRGVRHIGMPNIVAGREIVPEFIQGAATGWALAAALRELLGDSARRDAMKADLREVRARLGGGGAAERVAALAAEMMAEGKEARG